MARFKAWAALLAPGTRSGEWESYYEHWPELCTAFERFLDQQAPDRWSAAETEAVLYAVARDNEAEILAN